MNVEAVIDASLEAPLVAWLKKNGTTLSVIQNIADLSAKLSTQVIETSVAESVSLEGPLHIGAGTILRHGATISGPAIVGPNCVIGPNVSIERFSYVGSECKIGHSSYIENSIILNGTIIGPGSYICNAVIGPCSIIGPHSIVGVHTPHEGVENELSKDQAAVSIPARHNIAAGSIVNFEIERSPN